MEALDTASAPVISASMRLYLDHLRLGLGVQCSPRDIIRKGLAGKGISNAN
jgi:hypothetical protein